MNKKEVDEYNKQVEAENKVWVEFLNQEKKRLKAEHEILSWNQEMTNSHIKSHESMVKDYREQIKRYESSMQLNLEQIKALESLMKFYPDEKKKNAKKKVKNKSK